MSYGLALDRPCAPVYGSGMAHKIVAHVRRIKTGVGLAAVANHNCRGSIYDERGKPIEDLPDWISNPEKAKYNKLDRLKEGEIYGRRTARLDQAKAANLAAGQKWRKPQANASAAIEMVFSASPEWSDKPAQWDKLLRDCLDWVEKRYGKENVLQAGFHFDESTPHLHVLLVPVVQTDKGFKYSSDKFLGGRSDMQQFQTDVADQVGKKYGLERGVEGSRAKHNDLAGLAKQLDKRAADLEKKGQELAEWEKYMDDLEKRMVGREGAVAARETAVGRQEIHLAAKEAALHKVELQNGEMMQNLHTLRQEIKANLDTVQSTDFGKWMHQNLVDVPLPRRREVWEAAALKAAEIRAASRVKKTPEQGRDLGR